MNPSCWDTTFCQQLIALLEIHLWHKNEILSTPSSQNILWDYLINLLYSPSPCKVKIQPKNWILYTHVLIEGCADSSKPIAITVSTGYGYYRAGALALCICTCALERGAALAHMCYPTCIKYTTIRARAASKRLNLILLQFLQYTLQEEHSVLTDP